MYGLTKLARWIGWAIILGILLAVCLSGDSTYLGT